MRRPRNLNRWHISAKSVETTQTVHDIPSPTKTAGRLRCGDAGPKLFTLGRRDHSAEKSVVADSAGLEIRKDLRAVGPSSPQPSSPHRR